MSVVIYNIIFHDGNMAKVRAKKKSCDKVYIHEMRYERLIRICCGLRTIESNQKYLSENLKQSCSSKGFRIP